MKNWLLVFVLLLVMCVERRNNLGKGRNFSLAVWAEFLSYEEYEGIYPELEKLGVELYLAVREGTFPHPSLSKMKFRAWLLLDKEKGYWPSVWNAKEFFELVKSFISVYKDTVEWIVFDLEPPWEISRKLSELLQSARSITDIANFASELTKSFPAQRIYEEGKYWIRETVEFVRKSGLKAMLVTIPAIIDDLEDGDDDIQRKLGLPVMGINWDELGFMLYSTSVRTQIEKLVKTEVNYEYFVFTYSESVLNFFSKDKISVGIGLVGRDLFGNEGYRSPEEMKKDISAGIGAGVTKFHIWTVDNMRKDGKWDLLTWLDIGYVEPATPQPSSVIDSVRVLSKLLD